MNDRLTTFVNARLRGEPGPTTGRAPRSREDALLDLVRERVLRPSGWRSASELRGEAPATARGLADFDQSDDEPAEATAEELAAWDELDEATQAAAIEGDPAALAAWQEAIAEITEGEDA